MAHPSKAEAIQRILADGGAVGARDELLALVYDELHSMAHAHVQRHARGRTMRTTELVHEAWMRIGGDEAPLGFEGRAHFFGAAARAMRNILVDQARRRAAQKRDAGRREALPDDLPELTAGPSPTDVLALHDALLELEASHERAARVVELRFFSGTSMADIATALEVSLPTVERDWRFARAWLQERLGADELRDA